MRVITKLERLQRARRDGAALPQECAAKQVIDIMSGGDPDAVHIVRFWLGLIPLGRLPGHLRLKWNLEHNHMLYHGTEKMHTAGYSGFLHTPLGQHLLGVSKLPSRMLTQLASAAETNAALIREARNEAREGEFRPTLTQTYLARRPITIKGKREFFPNHALNRLRNALIDWYPSRYRGVTTESIKPTLRAADHDLRFASDLRYTPGIANRRRDAWVAHNEKRGGFPWVVTDRFIVDVIGSDGKVYVPERIEDERFYPVRFMEKPIPTEIRDGWLYSFGGYLGCSGRKQDAMKAAKMKAVRAAKESLGIL